MKIREHGTRGRYVFGAHGQDRAHGCRCPACAEANRAYARYSAKRVRLNRAHGAWARPYVDPTASRDHIEILRRQGLGRRRIAELAGLNQKAVGNIISNRSAQIRRETEQAILAVTAHPAGAALVDAGPTWDLINELLAAGVTKARIGQAVTGNPTTKALQLRASTVLARTAERVQALHREILGPTAYACTCGDKLRTLAEWAAHNDRLAPAEIRDHRLQVAS